MKRGAVTTQQEVEVVGGKFNTAQLNLNGGLFRITLADEAGTPLAVKPSWTIYGPANAEGTRNKLTYSYDKVPSFFLPAGPCQIKVKYGDKTATAEATVPAGILTEFTLKVKE